MSLVHFSATILFLTKTDDFVFFFPHRRQRRFVSSSAGPEHVGRHGVAWCALPLRVLRRQHPRAIGRSLVRRILYREERRMREQGNISICSFNFEE